MRGVDLIPGNAGGLVAAEGSTVRVLLKGRLFAKQGWVFINDYVEVDGKGIFFSHTTSRGGRTWNHSVAIYLYLILFNAVCQHLPR